MSQEHEYRVPQSSDFNVEAQLKPEIQPEESDRSHAGRMAAPFELHPPFFRKIVLAIATGFGTGFSPFASGTVGSLVAIPLIIFIAPPFGSWATYFFATLVFTALAVATAHAAEAHYQKKDDGRVVIDEVAGYLWTMLLVPVNPATLLLGFILFRIFDIIKPPPARQSQALVGGWGITIDDVFAGIYACFSLHLLLGLYRILAG